jgi:hypothetical protein
MRDAVSLTSDSAVTASLRAAAAFGSVGEVSMVERTRSAASRTAVRKVVSSSSRVSMRPGSASWIAEVNVAMVASSRCASSGVGDAEGGGGQFAAGDAGDAVDEFVGLVDDEQFVFGQYVHVGDGVDGEQGVVGDHDVGVAGLVAGLLGEAVGAKGAARRADALAR